MYEKEIEELERLLTLRGPTARAATAAIALMRAAQPKDEDAERETCAAFLDDHVEPREGENWLYTSRGSRIQYLMELRASARAETAVAVQPKDEAAEHDMHLRESDHPGECLTQLLMRERASARAPLARELSLEQAKRRAAEAELEAARDQVKKAHARIRELQLKLSQAESY